jgi:hypothetical protein
MYAMPPFTHSLFAIGLTVGRPQIGKPELTELRKLIRPFPKDAAERACYGYLLGLMQASPEQQRSPKAELKKYCRRTFRVTVDCFEYCWREAIKVSGANWDKPGRRPRR